MITHLFFLLTILAHSSDFMNRPKRRMCRQSVLFLSPLDSISEPEGGYVSAHVKSHCTRGAALLQAKLCLSSDKGSDDCPFNAALIVFEHHATLIQKRQKHKFVSLSQSVESVVSLRFWLHIILSFIHIYIPLQSHVFNTGLVTTATELWPASTSCLSFLISITSHNPNRLIFSPSCSILQYWYRGVLCVLSTR